MQTPPLAETPAYQQYQEDGFIVFRNVLDADLIAEANDHMACLIEKNPGIRPEALHNTLMTDDPFWVRLVSDPRLLAVAGQFIGPDIALFASHYIVKPPFTGQPVLWHQDGGYWPLDPMEVITLWLAIDHVDAENGCLRVIRGTHALELIDMTDAAEKGGVLKKETPPEYVDESKAVDIVLSPGDVEVHHPNIIHGSHANTSSRRRAGLTIRYIPATTRVTSAEPWARASLFFLQGADPGVNRYLPHPKYVAGKHMPFRGCEAWA